MTQSYCGKCGNSIQSDDLFCRKCGSPIKTEATAKEETKPRMPISNQNSQLIPPASLHQQPVVTEAQSAAEINQPMKYFSRDNLYVNAECQICGRVLKIPDEKCTAVAGGLAVNPAVICQCGTTSDFIGGVSSDYQASSGGKRRASSLIIQPRQINSTMEFADFVWKPSNRVYVSLSSNANADATIARENWWQQARSEIMNELQPHMIEGWQPITAPGADCWQCKTYKEHITKNWNALGWIIYLIISFATLLPFLLMFADNTYYEIIAFRVQLRRLAR